MCAWVFVSATTTPSKQPSTHTQHSTWTACQPWEGERCVASIAAITPLELPTRRPGQADGVVMPKCKLTNNMPWQHATCRTLSSILWTQQETDRTGCKPAHCRCGCGWTPAAPSHHARCTGRPQSQSAPQRCCQQPSTALPPTSNRSGTAPHHSCSRSHPLQR